MDKRRTFLSISRENQWRKGLLSGLEQQGDSIALRPDKSFFSGFFYSASVDSAEMDFEWQRVIISGDLGEDVIVRCSLHTQNTKYFSEEIPDIDEYIADPYINQTTKTAALNALFTEVHTNTTDFLADMRGRYIWVKIELISTGMSIHTIDCVRFQYSGDHMLEYLPEIYSSEDKSGFTKRFLSIFNNIALDMEEKIYAIGSLLDYELASGEMLDYLASWLCIEGEDEDDIKKRISTAFDDYRFSQTPAGLEKVIERWTGIKPIIVEHFNVEKHIRSGKDRELYKKLFGENPYRFFILLSESAFSDRNRADVFMERLKRLIPAHVEVELVLLKEGVYLDWNSYLGINTQVSDFKPAAISGSMALDYNTIMGSEDKEGGKA